MNFNHPSRSKVTKNSQLVGRVKSIIWRKDGNEASQYVVESGEGKHARTFTLKANKVEAHAEKDPVSALSATYPTN